MKRYHLLIPVVILIIPVVLNFVLPITTGLIILGGEGSPTIWLSFWGAYLAALGSFVLGLVSYYNNKEAVQQNEKILNNMVLEQYDERYNHLEKFMANEERHHNESFIRKVIEIMKKCQNDNERLIYLYTQKQKASLTSLYIIRFIEQEKAYDYQNETSRALYNYGMNLKDANFAIESYIDALIKSIKDNSSHSLDMDLFINKNDKLINDTINSCKGLIDSGTQILQAEKKRIRSLQKEIIYE